MGPLTFLCATSPQPSRWERILSLRGKRPFLSLALQLDLGPQTFAVLRDSWRGGKQIQFSFYFRSTHLKVFTLNGPESGSQTHTPWQALAWRRWPRQVCLYFHLPTQIPERRPMGDCVRFAKAGQLDNPEIPLMTQHA